MGKKKIDKHWFKCNWCGYYSDKETLIEEGYVDVLKTGNYCVWCPNPRCEQPTVVED